MPKNLPFRANPTPEVRFNVGEFGVDYYPRPGPVPSLNQYLLPENKTNDHVNQSYRDNFLQKIPEIKEWVKPLASLDIWLPPREPWKIPNPLPGLKPLTVVNLVFSYVGWFEEVPELLQELSHDSRSYIIHVQSTSLERFLSLSKNMLNHLKINEAKRKQQYSKLLSQNNM